MVIKNLLQKIFLQYKLYIIIKYLAPIAMILSLYSVQLIPQNTQGFEYQEPTMIKNIEFLEVNQWGQETYEWNVNSTKYKGVQLKIIEGMLAYETVLVSAPCSDQISMNIFNNIYLSFKEKYYDSQKMHIIKNIGLICYKNQTDLISFISEFSSPSSDFNQQIFHFSALDKLHLQKLGIIRSAFNLQFQSSLVAKNQSKIIFDMYDNQFGLNIDVDFYQYMKQHLQDIPTKWYPCQEMLISHRSIYLWLRKNTPLYKWGKLTFDFGFCQFVHMLKSDSANLNHGFIASGIQSVTVKTLIPKKSSSSELQKIAERIAKIAYSYTIMFSFFEDHLHSSNSLYYPFSPEKYIQVSGYFIPAALFLAFAGFSIAIQAFQFFSKKQQQNLQSTKQNGTKKIFKLNNVKIDSRILGIALTIWVCLAQYYAYQTLWISLWVTFLLRVLLSLLGFCLGERSGETLMVRAFLVVINIIYLVQVMLTNLPLVLLNIMVTFIICNFSPRPTLFIVVSLITFYFYTLGSTDPTFMLPYLKVSNSVGFLMMSLLGWANIF